MKIAMDGSLLSGSFSGVEYAILGLATALSKLQTDSEILLYVGKNFACPNLPAGSVKLRRAAGAGKCRLRRILWQHTSLPVCLKAEKVDVFHGPGYVLPMWGGTASVVTVYDIIALTHPGLCTKANAAHYRRVLPRSVRRAELVIVPTAAVANQVSEHLGISRGKICVVPCGIDARFAPASEKDVRSLRAEWKLPERFVLFVGNLEPKKNLTALVQAFFAAKMNKKLPHKLVLVGMPGWQYKPVLKEIEHLGMARDVIMPGYVPRELLPVLYSAAEMFAFPSLVEGFGLPPLEAMACGTPVIVSRDPALLETTGGAALDADASDLRSLREAIERLAERQELRQELAERGRRRAAEFNWMRAARETMDVYREALQRAKNRIRPEDLLQ